MNRQGLKNEAGFLLISSYLVLASLMATSLALWMRGVSAANAAERSLYQTEAFHLAESGLDVAIVNLEDDLTYAGTDGDVSYSKDGREVGSYNVNVTTPDMDNPYRKRVVVTGNTPDLNGLGRGEASRTIIAFVDLIPRQIFDFAVFARESVTLSGSGGVVVDSYDSAFGSYHSAQARSNAEVITNSTDSAAISLTGNVSLHGSATVGSGGDPSSGIYVGNNSSISGTTSAAISNKDYEDPVVPKSAQEMGDVVLASKDNLVLKEGTYVFDSLDMTGQSSISFTGPATVYIRGNTYIAGNGIATADNNPKNLIVQVVGNPTVEIAGNGDFYAGVYAPEAHVDISGNGDVYGGVIANTFYQHGGGSFHYDEDLKNQDPNIRLRAEVVSWQELNKFLG